MAKEGKVTIERLGAVALVTLNDPATRNVLSPPVVRELCTFFGAANGDDALGCIVLAASGDGFCSGGNIKDMRDGTDPMFAGTAHQMQEAFRDGVQVIPKLLNALDVPVIAAVQGAAIGAGCDLACMCDIRIAATDARFAESFLRVGLVSGDGGAWFLPRVVGVSRALEMALTCSGDRVALALAGQVGCEPGFHDVRVFLDEPVDQFRFFTGVPAQIRFTLGIRACCETYLATRGSQHRATDVGTCRESCHAVAAGFRDVDQVIAGLHAQEHRHTRFLVQLDEVGMRHQSGADVPLASVRP